MIIITSRFLKYLQAPPIGDVNIFWKCTPHGDFDSQVSYGHVTFNDIDFYEDIKGKVLVSVYL
jgi:hypothetical protein